MTFEDVWGRPLDSGTLVKRGSVAALELTIGASSGSVGLMPTSAQAREGVRKKCAGKDTAC